MNTVVNNADRSAISKSRQAGPAEVDQSSIEPGLGLNESPNLPEADYRAEHEPLPGVDATSSAEGPQAGGVLTAATTQPEPPPEQSYLADVQASQLLVRFLVGTAILGTDGLVERLRSWQAQLDSQSGFRAGGRSLDEATSADLVRYFVLGSLAWGSRRTAGAVLNGFRFSLGIAGAMYDVVDRLTDNRLFRPLRRPVDAAIGQVTGEVGLWVHEGWQEEQISRLLAGQALSHLLDEALDYVAENPQLAQLVRTQINEQSIGLADVVADNGRALGMTADDAVETLARRLFRRAPRSTLP